MNFWKSFVILLILFSINPLAMAQPKISEAHLEAMAKLDFLTGTWQGNGWMIIQGGQKVLFEQTEKVQWKLGQSVLMIEGMGKSEGKVIHDALAVLSYDPNQTTYNLRSYLANGRNGDFQVVFKGENQIIWYMEIPGRTIRYTLKINEKGQWHEIGEVKTGEDTWYHFFETTLNKM